ncbi:MAG: type VI secretion system tip protein TssI/VgrG [Pseudomonadota bacterium]
MVTNVLDDAKIEIHSWPTKAKVRLVRARVVQGISISGSIQMEFVSTDMDIPLEDVVGQEFGLQIELADGSWRKFWGICSHCDFVGIYNGFYALYRATLYDWFWLLTQSSDCRIFQDLKTTEILREVFNDIGFSEVEVDVKGADPKRTYCAQYNETDFAFVTRLMNEDGFYYWFEHGDRGVTLKIADSPGAHDKIKGKGGGGKGKIKFELDDDNIKEHEDVIVSISGTERIVTGAVQMQDYNYETSTASVTGNSKIAKGKKHNKLEEYTDSATQVDEDDGNRLARVRMEARAAQHYKLKARGFAREIEVGKTFELTDHPRKALNTEYLVTAAVHDFQVDLDEFDYDELFRMFGGELRTKLDGTPERYHVECNLYQSKEQYRTPPPSPTTQIDVTHITQTSIQTNITVIENLRATLRYATPNITTLQTAVVTGSSGDEIYTDSMGHVKVQFHWDRKGKKNEHTTCWMRFAVPWAGKNFGMIAIPRVGHEVIVQFVGGDPSRPIITGMLYNSDNMPPYPLPAEKTKSGIKTKSTTGGDVSKEYNEIFFDDKKGAELFNTQAQRDQKELIKHNQTIEVLNDFTQKTMRFNTDLCWGIRANITGAVQDTFVGGHQTEFTGIIKDETVGFYKAETVGLPRDLASIKLEGLGAAQSAAGVGLAATSFNDTTAKALGVSPDIVGTATTIAVASMGTALAAISAKLGAKVGKDETIHGNSNLTVTKGVKGIPGDRKIEIDDGDYHTKVKKGKRTVTIKKDYDTTIEEGRYFLKLNEKEHITSVLKGDCQLGIEKGDYIIGVDKGDMKVTVKSGKLNQKVKSNVDIKSESGSITIDAMQKITLKVGASKIELSASGIKISGAQVSVKGTATAELSAPKTDVKASGILIAKGSITKIN